MYQTVQLRSEYLMKQNYTYKIPTYRIILMQDMRMSHKIYYKNNKMKTQGLMKICYEMRITTCT